ncbi:MAG: ASKHA domain-containing protein [Candidatus Methanomethyliaceae archaeon]|nr:ASKHA domain-containing protein [Candidatus Methanomethyliaceae archaeon]
MGSWVRGSMEFEVKFLPEGKRISVPAGSTVMSAALRAGVDLANICGGKGFCGKCLVEVLDGNVPPPTDQERKRVGEEKIKKGYRLACQLTVQEDVTVQVPEQSRVGRQRLVIMGKEPPVALNPNVKKVYVEVAPPSLHDPEGDDVRIAKVLAAMGLDPVLIDYEIIKKMPKILRDGGWKVTFTILNNREIVNVQPEDRTKELYGVAVDIGTTKLAVFIVDLLDGGIIFAEGIMNPQIRYGEDVISRIGYASQSDENLKEVQKAIIDGINSLIQRGLEETGIKEEDLYELVAVGNTAMHHLFLGLDVKWLGFSPYPPVVGRAYNVRAKDLGIRINLAGNIHMLPNVAGFVGADAIADILASRIHEKDRLILLMDVGTNTEVVLGCREGLWSCSTASGPAFEGAHIKCGMRAASGAIEKVKIGDDFEVEYGTVDGEKARGICGSGIIDAVAEMLRTGAIDMSGKIVLQGHKRVRDGIDGKEFILVFKEETASGREDIVITQEDIREVQKAKAAMYAGYMTLMRKSGFRREELSEIIIAGAFGNYIDPENARIIGMIPELQISKISFLGNTAGSGARMCLKSTDVRREAESIAKAIKYVELAAEPIFEEEYVNAMYMPNSKLEDFPEVTASVKAPRVVRRYVRR